MTVLAIDPGPTESAWVLWNGTILAFRKELNQTVLGRLSDPLTRGDTCVIEKIASYGMAVGAEVFETVFWSGRFAERFGIESLVRMPRLEVKMHLCHDSRAKDGNIRQAIVDRFGGKDKAIGKKASPGPLIGISGDVWAALAVAITWWDKNVGVAGTFKGERLGTQREAN